MRQKSNTLIGSVPEFNPWNPCRTHVVFLGTSGEHVSFPQRRVTCFESKHFHGRGDTSLGSRAPIMSGSTGIGSIALRSLSVSENISISGFNTSRTKWFIIVSASFPVLVGEVSA
jgi:hypothetical protein